MISWNRQPMSYDMPNRREDNARPRPVHPGRRAVTRAIRDLVGLLLALSTLAHAQGDAPASSAARPSSTATAAPGPLDSIRKWLGGGGSPAELLPPDQAFQFSVQERYLTLRKARLSVTHSRFLNTGR